MSLTILDPGFITPKGMIETDPNHPMNIYKAAISQQSQAAMDQEWDPKPKRIRGTAEGFMDVKQYVQDIYLVGFLAVLMILVWTSVSQTTTPLYTLILTAALAVLMGIYYKKSNRTV
jgi:hypothetical protein